ncbi:hypothetical protein N7509_013024 [Penicillium cosmopolitanum]|uniref:AB hydrolase-1 domain-containing protein n=1 Tax=Penicillium cosmopolitanum TaxID=1131564 RepID=A0A9W9SH86_9EURO|nr:uncharacterized protein N7509_013024 [Penicillium cosmopolitanum]KAJ5376138.1 hypothetical protein N7509_013024 [Penicillium cosmopolitanum]
MSQPTLVVIPGSFSPPALYKNFVDNLRSLDFEAIVEPLQSAIRRESSPSSSMYDDASHFREVISKLADQGKDIVLIPHSYGGIVANESAKGLLKSDRSKAGKAGGIVEIVNISTLTPAVGETALDVAGKLGLDQFPVEGEYMVLEDEGCAKANYNDVPWDQALEFAKGHSDHSAKSFRDKLTYAAYLDIPSSWVFCERDVLLPRAFQRETIDLIEQRSGKKVRVFSIDAGHCVTSTRPKELAVLIQKILSK